MANLPMRSPGGGISLGDALVSKLRSAGNQRPAPNGSGRGLLHVEGANAAHQPLTVEGLLPAQARPKAGLLGEHAAPQRVSYPLGSLYNHVAPSGAITPFSYEEAKLPDERLYDPTVSPRTPFTFDVALYQVPDNMVLLVLGYAFSASRNGGVDIYDTQPLEPGRMKQSWIWDVNISGDRSQRNTTFQIVPTPIVQKGAGNGLLQAPAQNAFAGATARLAQSIGGAGLAGLPFDGREYGSDNAPFTLVAQQGQTVAVRCSIIRPLSVSLAAIEARIDGFLFPVTLLDAYSEAIQP